MTLKRASCLIVAVVCLLVTLPLVPSLIAGFSDFGLIAKGDRTTGFVTVEGCSRGVLIANWQCHGTFGYADPGGPIGAQPSTTYPDITVVNGYRHYAVGDQVWASLGLGTHNAYRSGTLALFGTLGLALLVLYELAVVLVVGFLSVRRAPVSALGPAILVVLTLLAMYGAWRPVATPPSGPSPAAAVSP